MIDNDSIYCSEKQSYQSNSKLRKIIYSLFKKFLHPFYWLKHHFLSSATVYPFIWWYRHCANGHKVQLIDSHSYMSLMNPKNKVLFKGTESPIELPKFIHSCPNICQNPRKLIQPEIIVTEYQNAEVIAGTDFIIVNNYCIHPKQFMPKRDFPHAERCDTIRIDPEEKQIISQFDPPAKINAAISLLGQSAGNYAHFVTEVLTKFIIIDRLYEYEKLPLLVDIWIDPILVEIINIFSIKKRKIYLVHLGEPVKCDFLVTISPPCYAPPEHRSFVKSGRIARISPEAYQFNVQALNLLRERANEIVSDKNTWIGKYLYIIRRSSHYGNPRNIINRENVERFMSKSGFDLIDPSSLTPKEQISAFQNAKIVVAPVGASLVNLTYTKPGCKVICLSADLDGCQDGEYDYFSSMMHALGHDMVHVVGPRQRCDEGHPLHTPYRVPMNDLAKAVSKAMIASQHIRAS